jgi:imidazole glycerol-phosphate synthase subunit HisH
MIAIIDYGMGNLHSVQKALESMGAKTLVTNKPQDLNDCDKIVLPGVGAFDDAVSELEKQNLNSALIEQIKNKKIFLGICLGMQLLFERSEEANKAKGLSLLKGQVRRFENRKGFKVPHMGWNQLHKVNGKCPLLRDIPDNSYVYFCHSYYPAPTDEGVIAATTDYGIEFVSIIWRDNIYGLQFHPEKSQDIGIKILRNFADL